MKLGWFILLVLLAAGCSQPKKEMVDPLAYAVITGHIKNRQVYPQQYSLKVIIPSFVNSQTIQECAIKDDHTFSFRFQPLALRDISIETFASFILIRPGDSLHIELDFADLNKVQFSGTAGKLNQDLYAFTDGGGYYLTQHVGTNEQMMAPDAFRALMKEEREVRWERFRDFAKKYEVEPDLEKWIKKGLEAEYYQGLMDYGMVHRLITGDSVPEDFYDFNSSVEELFTEDVMHSHLFELSAKFLCKPGKNSDSTVFNIPEVLENVANCTQNEVLSQFVVASILDGNLGCNDVVYFEENRAFFDEHVTIPLLRESLLQKYRDKKAYVTHPKLVSDAMLYGVSRDNGLAPVFGPGMKKLQEVVENNKGKVMLINFWDGCPFALKGLDGINQLTELYKGKDVELVSVAGDAGIIKKWAEEHHLKGQKYFWPHQDIGEIKRNWHVNWSPYYLLINKEGVIVDYGTHIAPGSAYSKKKINQLLEE